MIKLCYRSKYFSVSLNLSGLFTSCFITDFKYASLLCKVHNTFIASCKNNTQYLYI